MQIGIKVAYGVGSQMGVIKGVNKVTEDGKADLKHEEGQVILLDFWATWCPPCQKPMAHNQEMLEKRGKDWADKVRFLGLSIDDSPKTVKEHVTEKNKWTAVEHYHVKTEGCTADDEYGVEGVPHVLLVDTTGKIVFVGHPSSRDLEKDIDALLKGETLSGEGTGASASKGEESKETSGAGDASKIAETKESFKATQKTFLEGEAAKTAGGKLQRGFVVLVDEQSYDVKTRELKHKLECHLQLMGSQEGIDAVKDLVKDLAYNDLWKTNEMFRAM